MVACTRISFTASSITRLVELADPNCATKTSSSVTWRASTSLHSHETLAADRNRWRASLSFGYSLSATSYAEKMEKRRAHRRQRRDEPWWWWWWTVFCAFLCRFNSIYCAVILHYLLAVFVIHLYVFLWHAVNHFLNMMIGCAFFCHHVNNYHTRIF